MPLRRLWVARLHVTSGTAAKLRQKHSLEPEALRQAIECVEGLTYVWDVSPVHGGRYIVEVFVRGDRVLATMVPDEGDPFGDSYVLRTAFRVHRGR